MPPQVSLTDPLTLPLEFKGWLLEYVSQELVAARIPGSTQLVSTVTPWLVDVDVFLTPVASTNWSTLVGAAQYPSGNALYGGHRASSGAQNDSISFDLMLADGVWTVELLHITGPDTGIYTLSLDGTSVGTVDGYSAAAVVNVHTAVTGVRVSGTRKRRLLVQMASKNASASSYFGRLQRIQLRRTA